MKDRSAALRRKLRWRVDLYRHTEHGGFDDPGPCKFFPSLRTARTFARSEVFHGEWHHAVIDQGDWVFGEDIPGEWEFVVDDTTKQYDVWDPYVEIPTAEEATQ